MISRKNEQTKFTVVDIVASNFIYKSVDNHDLNGDSDGTNITVSRP